MTNETYTTICINKAGEAHIKAKLKEYGLEWNLNKTFLEIEEKAENQGADLVSEQGYEYETGTRSALGYIRTITLDPIHFDFEEKQYS